jgi:hypothetical protein
MDQGSLLPPILLIHPLLRRPHPLMQKPQRIDLSVAKDIQLVQQFTEFVPKIIFEPPVQLAQSNWRECSH